MSPKIFEYNGISLEYYSNEHLPVHVHAYYSANFRMKVEFYLKGDMIVRKVYKGLKGYRRFPPAQLRDLKKLIDRYQDDIVKGFINFAVKNLPAPKKVVIRRKIK